MKIKSVKLSELLSPISLLLLISFLLPIVTACNIFAKEAVTDSSEIEFIPGYLNFERLDLNSEDFDPEKYNIPAEKIVKDGDRKVLALKNETTGMFGMSNLSNYIVKGKVKIANRMLDKEDYNTSFEISVRRQYPDNDNPQGRGGYNFVYKIENDKNDNYLRIDYMPGPSCNIDDNLWHDFSAEIVGKQMIFNIDGTTHVFYLDNNDFSMGGFSLRAVNCEVYIDDLELINRGYISPVYVLEKLEAFPSEITIVKHDVIDLGSLSSIKAVVADGKSNYISPLTDVRWSVLEGEEKVEFIGNSKIRFKKDVNNNEKITLRASLLTNSSEELYCDINITVVDPGISEMDYIRKGTKKRQENHLRYLLRRYDKGAVFGPDNIGQIANAFSKQLLYPEEKNYDREIRWLIDMTGSEEDEFIINQMITTYKMLNGRTNVSKDLWEEMVQTIQNFLFITPDMMPTSENHSFAHLAGAFITCETWPNVVMKNKKTGKENIEYYKYYLENWMNTRLKRGLIEFDAPYVSIDYIYLSFLNTFVKNKDLKSLSEDLLEYLYADVAMDSIDGIPAGAQGRGYPLVTYFNNSVPQLFEIYFGNGVCAVPGMTQCQIAPALVAMYRPSDILGAIVRDTEKRFTNKEKRIIHHAPDDENVTETLKKYTHVTPEYVLGSMVHSDIALKFDDKDSYRTNGRYYYRLPGVLPGGTQIDQGLQEKAWSLYIGKSPGTFIFDSHPGTFDEGDGKSPHNYFTGDSNCLCGKYFQEENVLIGMHKITGNKVENKKLPQFTHFWIPKPLFERVDEEDGWIFVKQLNTYVAIKPLKDGIVSNEKHYSWGNPVGNYISTGMPLSQLEAKIESANTAFVCQVVDTSEFDGSFEKFKEEVKKCSISYSIDGDEYFIEFTGLNGKKIKLDYNSDTRYINGVEADVKSYKLQDSPYLQADWEAGEITFRYGDMTKTIKARYTAKYEKPEEGSSGAGTDYVYNYDPSTSSNNPALGNFDSIQSALVYNGFELPETYRIRVVMKFNKSNCWAGVIFNYQDVKESYMARMKSGTNQIQVIKASYTEPGVPPKLVRVSQNASEPSPIEVPVRKHFVFEVEKLQNEINVYVNGEKTPFHIAIPVTDGGKLGFFATAGATNAASVEYKDLQVYDIETGEVIYTLEIKEDGDLSGFEQVQGEWKVIKN